MFYPYTERQGRFVAIAQDLAEIFSERASKHDLEGTFPFENYDDLRTSGLPALVVPEDLGGWGATLLETLITMETLATGDGSTALSVTMHMQTIGNAAETGDWPRPLFEQICREVVEQGALINTLATEPELGSPSRGGKPKTVARPIYDEAGRPVSWIISGRKNYASMVPVLDTMIIPATLQDSSGKVARFAVRRDEHTEIIPTWNAMGMRTTGSHDIVLHDVTVPHSHMILRTDSSSPGTAEKLNAWFMLVVSAVYVGVALAAQRAAARYASERVPTALGRSIATLEGIQRRMGQVELLLYQARSQLYASAEQWDRHPEMRKQMADAIVVAKITATNNAISAVDHCMRVVGGASMTRALPLERYYRDVRGGLSHPMNDDQALIMLGKMTLQQLDDG